PLDFGFEMRTGVETLAVQYAASVSTGFSIERTKAFCLPLLWQVAHVIPAHFAFALANDEELTASSESDPLYAFVMAAKRRPDLLARGHVPAADLPAVNRSGGQHLAILGQGDADRAIKTFERCSFRAGLQIP